MNYVSSIFFYGLCFWYVTKKSLPNPKSQRFSYIFYSRYFIVLGFIFRTVIHLRLNCVYDIRYGSRFFFFAYGLFQHHFWKRLSFHWVAFEYLSKNNGLYRWRCISGVFFFFFNQYHLSCLAALYCLEIIQCAFSYFVILQSFVGYSSYLDLSYLNLYKF